MSVSMKIREELGKYLSGEISLQEFQDWFVPETWDIHKSGDQEGIELAREVELRLAEYTNGHRTESELKQMFSRFALVKLVPDPVFTSNVSAEINRFYAAIFSIPTEPILQAGNAGMVPAGILSTSTIDNL